MENKDALINYCLRLGDSSLILGQRMAEWCSKGPILEEDIAMTNISLDLFGQSRMLFSYIAELEGGDATEDSIAFKRNEREFFNTLISERPNGHFGDTIARNFLVDAFNVHYYTQLVNSKNEILSTFAEKSLKESIYHLRHTGEWMVRLGDGTEESKDKIQKSLNNVWKYAQDMFDVNDGDKILIENGIAIDPEDIKLLWSETIDSVLKRANLVRPEDGYSHMGSRNGIHSEYLGHLLTEMQYIPRAYPDSKW